MRLLGLATLIVILSAPAVLAGGEAVAPDAIAGLRAWYNADALLGAVSDGEVVGSWPDSSGNGNSIVHEEGGQASKLRIDRLNGGPVVDIRTSGSYRPREPFALGDHTIVLVAGTRYPEQVFFRSDSKRTQGVMLYDVGGAHVFRSGEVGEPLYAYSDPLKVEDRFRMIVLGRKKGELRAFMDGVDVSSFTSCDLPLRVGVFFQLAMTQFVHRDGRGLQVAEMIFYDRFLTDHERTALTTHLSKRYDLGIDPEQSIVVGDRIERLARSANARLARLTTSTMENLNTAAVRLIDWSGHDRLDAPFKHDAATDPSRLYSTENGTRVRLYVVLPMRTKAANVSLRVLVLKNGAEYLGDGVQVAPTPGSVDRTEFTIEVALDAGDSIEIVSLRSGAEGEATLADGAVLMVEALD